MLVHRALRDEKFVGDLLIGQSPAYPDENLLLAGGEIVAAVDERLRALRRAQASRKKPFWQCG